MFGLGGVLGSGRTELARALFGVDRLTRGGSSGRAAAAFRSPRHAVAAGLALVPENRKFDGLFFNFAGFPEHHRRRARTPRAHGLIDLAREAEHGRALVRDLEITPAAEVKEVGSLSGGNQQKVVIARWLFAGADLFILDEPTQGIDIGAKIAVYRLINRLTASGKAVILISSDHDELIAMSDRIGLMSHGRLVAVRERPAWPRADLVQASGRDDGGCGMRSILRRSSARSRPCSWSRCSSPRPRRISSTAATSPISSCRSRSSPSSPSARRS